MKALIVVLAIVLTADLAASKCNGGNGCCTPSNRCGVDEGDCDTDADCKDGLACGTNNCPQAGWGIMGFSSSDDCCYGIKVDGQWTGWQDSGDCSATCGAGSKPQTRSCVNRAYGGADCQGDSTRALECNTNPCPVDGKWGEWSDAGECTVSCGGGTKEQSRSCDQPAPAHGGANCGGPATQTVPCNPQPCPVDGGWGAWVDVGECTVSCGGGTKEQSRPCDQPAPAFGGADCAGSPTQAVPCNSNPCPVDGGWDDWSDTGDCSVSCGAGTKEQARTCTNPIPAHGGVECAGPAIQAVECNPKPCPINGGWGDWQDSSECTVSCGSGTKAQVHACDSPAPAFGGADCAGADTQTVDCNPDPCPIDGGWGPWEDSGACSKTCGSGSRVQTRACSNPAPQFGGADCVGSSTQSLVCNTNLCPAGCTGNDKCCRPDNQCGDGEGDCDRDEDCQPGLVCGWNNCKGSGFDWLDDCCVKP